MKKIEAIIRKEKLERVKMLLATLGYKGLTMADVSGLGTPPKVGSNDHQKELPKMKIELVVNDEDVSQVLNAIVRGAKTGMTGDGNIFIIPIENMIRVRTGDSGINAI
jgi:nitrogen regulatory protein P-II 1